MDFQEVLNEVESWPVDDRIRLVQEVWDGLAGMSDDPELTAEMRAELDLRIEEMDRDPSAGVPWEQVKAKALERIRK